MHANRKRETKSQQTKNNEKAQKKQSKKQLFFVSLLSTRFVFRGANQGVGRPKRHVKCTRKQQETEQQQTAKNTQKIMIFVVFS